MFTRNGHDWTDRFKKIATDAWHLNVKSAIIDGKVIVPSANGVSDFSVLQRELKRSAPSKKLVVYTFDLLYLNGFEMRNTPLIERKAQLETLVKKSDILFSNSFEVDGTKMYQHCCGMGLEGVVSKRKDSKYQSGRSNDWIKLTCRQRETLPIVGYGLKEGKFDGLYLGTLNTARWSMQARLTTGGGCRRR